jgi:8-oxo-dGTP pyrophosphatase MutT (NUDIX family)
MTERVRQSALAALSDWEPLVPEQDSLRYAVMAYLEARPDSCQRACVPGHITASTLVVDHTTGAVLLTLHPRLGKWVQLGGHCEEVDATIVAAALREATEESGIPGLEIDPVLAAVHVHPVTCSLGVPTRHLDLQFIATAPPGAQPVRSDESLDLRWWPLDALPPGADAGLARLVDVARRRAPTAGPSDIA